MPSRRAQRPRASWTFCNLPRGVAPSHSLSSQGQSFEKPTTPLNALPIYEGRPSSGVPFLDRRIRLRTHPARITSLVRSLFVRLA